MLSTNSMNRQISKDPQHAIGAVLGTMAESNGVLKMLTKIGGFGVFSWWISLQIQPSISQLELVSGFGSGGVLENLAYGLG